MLPEALKGIMNNNDDNNNNNNNNNNDNNKDYTRFYVFVSQNKVARMNPKQVL